MPFVATSPWTLLSRVLSLPPPFSLLSSAPLQRACAVARMLRPVQRRIAPEPRLLVGVPLHPRSLPGTVELARKPELPKQVVFVQCPWQSWRF